MATRRMFIPVTAVLACSTLVGAYGSQGDQKPKVQSPSRRRGDHDARGSFRSHRVQQRRLRLAGLPPRKRLVGQEWILIEIGATVRDGQPNYKLKRTDVSLTLPDNSSVPLPSNTEYRQSTFARSNNSRRSSSTRSTTSRPARAARAGSVSSPRCRAACSRTRKSSSRRPAAASAGSTSRCRRPEVRPALPERKFANSLVRVPFRIMTKDEEKFMEKNWKDIKKQVDDAFKKGK